MGVTFDYLLEEVVGHDHAELQKISEKGQANGYASLDANAKVPAVQLPNSIMEYQGSWNATTNSPALADGDTANAGNVYRVTIAGTQNLGSGSITFNVGDYVICNASGVWEKCDNTELVTSVDGRTGAVTLNDLYAPTAKGVTNGDTHDHSGGDGGQINHTTLSNIGTNTHAQIDTALTRLANTSGTNTGDQDLSSYITTATADAKYVDVAGDAMTGDLTNSKRFEAPVYDLTLGTTDSDQFIQNTTGTPTGWNIVDAAAASSTNTKYSYWYLSGTVSNPAWEFTKQSSVTVQTASNSYQSFYFNDLLIRDGNYTADMTYIFGIYADNAGTIDKTKYCQIEVMWDTSLGIWKVRGVASDGLTTSTGTYFVTSFPPMTMNLRIVFNGFSTQRLMRAYMGSTSSPSAQTQILSTVFSTFPTMGQAWRGISHTRAGGIDDYLYIGSVDYDTGNA